MRPNRVLAVLIVLGFAAALPLVAAEATRTLKLDLAPAGPFVVENLVGTMRVVAGTGDRVVVNAAVHGESDEVAALVTLEQVAGESGAPTLRLIYPIDKYSAFRHPGKGEGGSHSIWDWFGGSSSTVNYAGHRVKVGSSGVLLYADVEVQVPGRSVEGTFRNLVGRIDAKDLQGTIKLDTASGDINVENVRGDLKADTGSGDVKASRIDGSFKCDTGSGDCDATGLTGEKVDCDTGSGEIRINDAKVRIVKADTGSGDVRASDVDAEEFEADTGSGDVVLEARDGRLVRIKADTGSGDITLRLGPDASFEASADQGSGNLVSRYQDAQPIVKGKVVVGYRRGDGRTRITADTGSGDVTIEPLR